MVRKVASRTSCRSCQFGATQYLAFEAGNGGRHRTMSAAFSPIMIVGGVRLNTLTGDTLKRVSEDVLPFELRHHAEEDEEETEMVPMEARTWCSPSSPDVLTAAHVFNDASLEVDGRMRKVPVARVRVSPARNGDNTSHPLGTAYSKAIQRPQGFTAENDYALIGRGLADHLRGEGRGRRVRSAERALSIRRMEALCRRPRLPR